MSQLTFAQQPGFVDLQDSSFSFDQPAFDAAFKQLNALAKGGAVRPEPLYAGWYKNGDVVPLQISPVDGYAYSRAEQRYVIVGWATRGPGGGFVSGQKTRPGQANGNGGSGQHYWQFFDIDDSSGTVYTAVSYWNGTTETITSDGMVKVQVMGTRLSINNDGGTN